MSRGLNRGSKMEFSEIKAGDMIRVTTAAHTRRKGFGSGGPVVGVPAKTVTVRVESITGVNGFPGRQQAWCSIFVTAEGEDLSQVNHLARPRFDIFSDSPTQTFEKV